MKLYTLIGCLSTLLIAIAVLPLEKELLASSDILCPADNNELSVCEAVKKPTLALSMIVRNEADRYLKKVLEHASDYVDWVVIIDDASTDNTVEVCRTLLKEKGIPLYLIQNSESTFSREHILRKQQWEETIKTNPDWILILDADELFEDRFKKEVRTLIEQDAYDLYYFRLYDFWDATHYREDTYWSAHRIYRPFLLRYKKDFVYEWKEWNQHSGRMPINILSAFPQTVSQLRVKHLGWMKPEDRVNKYRRCQELDPGARFGWKEQYESILDEHPHLVPWQE